MSYSVSDRGRRTGTHPRILLLDIRDQNRMNLLKYPPQFPLRPLPKNVMFYSNFTCFSEFSCDFFIFSLFFGQNSYDNLSTNMVYYI